jgi:hypothetical protein
MQWLGGYRLRSERPLSSTSHKAEPNVRRSASPDQGLRKDLTLLDGSQVEALAASLRKHGVADDKISLAIAEAGLKSA